MSERGPDELTTEGRNADSDQLDELDSLAIVALMNRENERVLEAMREAEEPIARAIDAVAERMERGGRLFYTGAGTSGRLGVVDASECPPTFSASPEQVIGLIAGGDTALRTAVEGAEDSREFGADDLRAHDFGELDTVVGISASGGAAYVLGAIEHAREVGGLTAAICCNRGSPLAAAVDIPIEVVVGPEVLSGSTRLKAGTATKLVLNALSTGVMVRLGKCFGNLMVDLQASNQKLRRRAVRIVAAATGLDEPAAESALARSNGEVKTAIVAVLHDVAANVARRRLDAASGRVRRALSEEV